MTQNLKQKLKKTSASLTAVQKINFDPVDGGLALVVVDVEPEYCDPTVPAWVSSMLKQGRISIYNKMLPEDMLLANFVRGNKQTHEAATKIASIAPEFRKAGARVIAVNMDLGNFEKPKDPVFHVFKTEKEDQIFPKNCNSAFKSTLRKKFPTLKTFNKLLSESSIETIIICGVNQHACVADTALDGRKKGYNVIMLTDAVADDNKQKFNLTTNKLQRQKMKDAGVVFMTSAEVLKKIHAKQNRMVPA